MSSDALCDQIMLMESCGTLATRVRDVLSHKSVDWATGFAVIKSQMSDSRSSISSCFSLESFSDSDGAAQCGAARRLLRATDPPSWYDEGRTEKHEKICERIGGDTGMYERRDLL